MRNLLIVFICLFCFTFISCTSETDSTTEQDSSLDGIDISKLEQPQTEFMYDGHTLSDYEEIAKMIITKGTFVYDTVLAPAIGYKYVLKTTDDYTMYAFYSVDNIKIFVTYKQDITIRGRSQSYNFLDFIRLSRDNTTLALEEVLDMGFRISNRRGEVYYGIYESLMKDFNSSATGEWILNRGSVDVDLEATASQIISHIDEALNLLNDLTKENISKSLSTIGLNQYN